MAVWRRASSRRKNDARIPAQWRLSYLSAADFDASNSVNTERVAMAYRLLSAYALVSAESEQNSSHPKIACDGMNGLVENSLEPIEAEKDLLCRKTARQRSL